MSVFQRYNQTLAERHWSLRYWDGRPTHFLPSTTYEELVSEALESSDVSALNVLIDEVDPELMADVADQITDYATPTLLEWYITTTYPPLFATLTPERFLESPDLQDALATWPQNLYILHRWYQALGATTPSALALQRIQELFIAGSITPVPAQLPTYTLASWQVRKKARFLADRASQGIGVVSPSNASNIIRPLGTLTRNQLPRRQGSRY